ncbi:MAG: hypothetical protein L7U87_04915 [Chlamydiales bacterium]|nr:hypothetical protein [Chlamydiales bacterium]
MISALDCSASFIPFYSLPEGVEEKQSNNDKLQYFPAKRSAYSKLPIPDNKGIFSSNFKIPEFLDAIGEYAVVKLSEYFPEYYSFNDIDILVKDPEQAKRAILKVAEKYKSKGVNFTVKETRYGYHIDAFVPGRISLDLRFDIIGPSEALFTETKVSSDFFIQAIDSRKQIWKNGIKVYVPSEKYELAFRYLEYKDKIKKRKDKIKHLRYVRDAKDRAFLGLLRQHTDARLSGRSLEREFKNIPISEVGRDLLIIWSPGMKYKEQILQRVREFSDIKIQKVEKIALKSLEPLFKVLYEKEQSKSSFLKKKLKHLKKYPAEFLCISMKNLRKDMVINKEAKEYSFDRRIRQLKELIRNQFNPRGKMGERTERHVVHTPDNASEVKAVKEFLRKARA